MPEIKNTFLKSKMNKDLDSRIVPNGEYRDANNVSVSRSEGSDVGSLENVLGNISLTDLKNKINTQERNKIEEKYSITLRPSEVNTDQIEIIGYHAETSRDLIFLFLTDYRDTSSDRLSNFASPDEIVRVGTSFPPVYSFRYKGAGCYIVQYNALTNESTILVSGSFLNFSKTQPIYNVDLLEDLLFWTDNRNQPRKINIKKALNNPWENSGANDPYYYSEVHISVAKYAPVYPFEFIDSSNESTLISNNEEFLPTHIITACNTQTSSVTDTQITIVGEYTFGTSGNVDIITDPLFPWEGDVLIIPTQEQSVSSGDLTEDLRYEITAASTGTGTTTLTLATQLFRIIDAGSKLYIKRRNPSYDENYQGDENLLKEDFAKFSYRFKYDDNEYSLMAPFTQSAFIPKQFGYFLENQEASDEERTYESTVVSFMENQVNRILLQIPMPDEMDGTQINANELLEKLKVEEIEILYKESDGLAVSVVDRITTEDLNAAGAVNIYEYDYQATEPFKVLPEDQTTRVYDKVPVKALGQEIISNRVVYSNFQNKHTPPAALD